MPLAYGLTESVDLGHPAVPTTFADGTSTPHAVSGGGGLRIAHLTDLHIVKPTARMAGLTRQLAKVRLDLGLLTGDYMVRHKPHQPAIDYLRDLTAAVQPIHGWVGILGNHDTPQFLDAAAELPIRWLIDDAIALDALPIDLLGLGREGRKRRPDGVACARSVAKLPDDPDRLRLALTHRPDDLPLCADLGAHLAFAGHTHGGQIRIPIFKQPLFNGSDLPLSHSSGMLRHQDTLMLVPRGLGSTDLLRTPFYPRLACPPHAPIYSLRKATLPGEHTHDIHPVWQW